MGCWEIETTCWYSCNAVLISEGSESARQETEGEYNGRGYNVCHVRTFAYELSISDRICIASFAFASFFPKCLHRLHFFFQTWRLARILQRILERKRKSSATWRSCQHIWVTSMVGSSRLLLHLLQCRDAYNGVWSHSEAHLFDCMEFVWTKWTENVERNKRMNIYLLQICSVSIGINRIGNIASLCALETKVYLHAPFENGMRMALMKNIRLWHWLLLCLYSTRSRPLCSMAYSEACFFRMRCLYCFTCSSSPPSLMPGAFASVPTVLENKINRVKKKQTFFMKNIHHEFDMVTLKIVCSFSEAKRFGALIVCKICALHTLDIFFLPWNVYAQRCK